MNFENGETSEPYRLLINLKDKINFKKSEKYVPLLSLSIYYSYGHNILRIFYVLPNFPFITSETKPDY